jgi:hypothetical protein
MAPLIEVLKKGNIDVRLRIIRSLGVIGGDRVIEPLIQSLKDHHYAIRFEASKLLGTIGSNRAFEPLIQSLNDSKVIVGFEAAKALVAIDRNRAIEPLIQSLRGKYSIEGFISALGDTGSNRVIESLIQALKSGSAGHRRSALEAFKKLTKFNLNLSQQLPHLVQLTSIYPTEEALSVITAIQARCKYYNYDIAQTPLQETENHANPVERILQEIHQTIKIMSETGKYNIKAEVVQIVEKNSGQVIGKNSGQAIGKKYANDPALLQTINEITQVLANLQKAHPTATEAEAKDIIEAEFKEIQTNQPNRWTTFRQQLLNRDRSLNGGKATISEIAKHYAENNVFLIAGVAFLDGFSAEGCDL